MSRPTTMNPSMARFRSERLTPRQELALQGLRVEDIVLAERRHATPQLMLVDTITSNVRDEHRVGTRAQYEVNPQNVFDLQRYGSWNLKCISFDWPAGRTLCELLEPTDELTLNPDIGMLKEKFLHGICVYPNCVTGLVHKSPPTVNEVHFLETEARAGREVWSLCPFCMGERLQRQHECLVTCPQPERYAPGVLRAHLEKVNLKRVENHYPPLPYDVDMVVLFDPRTETVGGQSRPPTPEPSFANDQRPNRRPGAPSPTHSRHSSRSGSHAPHPGPRLSSHTFLWFRNARERVLNDVCGLCQDDYQDVERVIDLPCQHFYHEKCLEPWLEYQRDGDRELACPLCRRMVVS